MPLVDQAKPENQAAARAVIDQVLGTLLWYTGWLVAIAFVVLVVALVTGPYPWAVRVRGWAARRRNNARIEPTEQLQCRQSTPG
jgi:hypothetical protein